MAIDRTCDGVQRRDFLKIGALGATGFTLANFLRWTQADELRSPPARCGIFIHLAGGPSHLDTFDMKPEAPEEFRGSFTPISTNVRGIQICEHLPKLATCADKYVILRGVSHSLAAHQLGSQYVNTGTRPIGSLEYPGYGAVVTKETWKPGDLPPFVAIPRNTYQQAGFLGIKYGALNTGNIPIPGQPFTVRGIALQDGVTINEVERRQSLLKDLDTAFRGFESNQLIEGLDQFSRQAYEIITSPRSRKAFDVSKEPESMVSRFGKSGFGMSCLLAMRLIEFGVRFVTITNVGWDTHAGNFTRLKENLLPPLDEGLSGLITGLSDKGLLDTTALFVTGEFGRTPKINAKSRDGGRDHYPRCMTMMLAGGGMRGGQVIGESDEKATAPKSDLYSPGDVAASFYHALGIDHAKEYHTPTGRPVMIVREGEVISGLFG